MTSNQQFICQYEPEWLRCYEKKKNLESKGLEQVGRY